MLKNIKGYKNERVKMKKKKRLQNIALENQEIIRNKKNIV